jgi:hypothetical protein
LLWGVASAGVVYTYSVDRLSTRDSVQVTGNGEGNWAAKYLANHIRPPGVLFPGQAVEITKPPSFVVTPFTSFADPSLTGAWKATTTLIASLAEMAGDPWERWSDASKLLDKCSSLDNALGCVKEVFALIIKEEAEKADAAKNTKLGNNMRMISHVVKAIDLTGVVASLSLALASGNFGLDKHATFANVPNKPVVDGEGRAIVDGCLSFDTFDWHIDAACQDNVYRVIGRAPGSSYIARDPGTHRAVLVTPTGVIKNIGNGGIFNCLAATMFVIDVATLPALGAPTQGEASCLDAGPIQWDFRPVRDGGNIPDNVILRERPEDAGTGPISNWLINNRGEIQTIENGGIYLCLAYANPVIWNVPYGNAPFTVGIDWWRPVGTAPASCG